MLFIKKNGQYTNDEIAELLTAIATAYEIKNKNYFRIVSYQNAAESVMGLSQSIQSIWKENPKLLDDIPHIGTNIFKKLNYLFSKNRLHPSIEKTFQGIHPSVFTFTKVNGIGPKNAHKITTQLEFPNDPIEALDKLIEYAKMGAISKLETFGDKSEKLILENTLSFLGRKDKMPLKVAEQISEEVVNFLKTKFPAIEIIPLGSLRRRSPLVGDIDLAAKSKRSTQIIEHFVTYPKSIQTIIKGPKKASIRIKNDIRIDLMVQSSKTFGSLLQHFTGSRQHNIELRKYAQSLGYSLSEYGIKDLRSGEIHTFSTEEKFYNFLKLKFIPPEMRLGEDEIEKAKML